MNADDGWKLVQHADTARAARGITTCVHAAMLAGELERLRLLQGEEDCELSPDWWRCFSEVSHLHRAAFNGDLRSVKRFVKDSQAGGSPDIGTIGPRLLRVSNTGDDHFGRSYAGFFTGTTPLMMACQQGHLSVVKFLVENHYADINSTDSTGLSPLSIACAAGQLSIVKYLVSHHAAVNLHEHGFGMTPVLLAAVNNHIDVVKYIAQHGAHVTDSDREGRNAMHYAAWNYNSEMVTFLYWHDDDGTLLTSRDSKGDTPLHVLVSDDAAFPEVESVSDLEKTRLNDVFEAINVYDKAVVVDLARTVSRGHGIPGEEPMCLVRMLNLGANVNIGNNKGQLAIHTLCSRLTCVKYCHGYVLTDTPTVTQTLLVLLQILQTKGSRTDDLDSDNMAPLEYSARQGNCMAMQLLDPAGRHVTSAASDDGKTLKKVVEKYGWHKLTRVATLQKDIEWMAAAAIAQKKESRRQQTVARLYMS